MWRGVEPQSETVWRQADRYRVPRVAFVNKMDRVGADFDNVVHMIDERLGARPIPIQIPIGAESEFQGLIDVVEGQAIYWDDESLGAEFRTEPVPAEFEEKVAEAREKVLEAAADFDEELMADYLEGREVSPDALRKALRQATLNLEIVPVLCGTAFRNKGVQPLLDAVVDLLPSPLDVPPVEGTEPKSGDVVTRKADDNEPLCALAFKLMSDPHVGHLSYVRLYSGRMKKGDTVLNVSTGKREKVGRLLQMHANKRQDLDEACAGDILAVVGLKRVKTGETLSAVNAPILLESLEFPNPVINIAIEPKTTAAMDRLSQSLERLAVEDPSFRVSVDEETGQTLIAGMGELHLEIITDRLLREFKVDANVGRPQVAYKETITQPATVEGRYIKQTGGSGDYGVVKIEVSPGELGSGFGFESAIVGGAIPKEFVSAVRQGCEESAQSGALAGYPVVDVHVKLIDGQTHDVDSSERSFKIAGSMAMRDALEQAGPVMLEPIMSVEVVTPEDFVGGVQGDLNSRRGQIKGIEARNSVQVIEADVPLSRMFGYVNSLRSMTQGRASYTMQFSHYAEVPASASDEIRTW